MQLHDPEADGDLLQEEYQLDLTPLDKLQPADAVVLAVAHASYRKGGWDLIEAAAASRRGFVADVPALLDRTSTPEGVTLWRL